MLSLQGINKSFAQNQVLKNLDLNIAKGEFYSLLGPNGAGKSTTINIIAQLIKPDSGKVMFNELDAYQHQAKIKSWLGVVPQEIALYEELTAWENIIFWGSLNKLTKSAIQKNGSDILTRFGLYERRNEKIKTYSGGMKRRINIAVALLHDPQLILMDEPTVGIDPQSRNNIYEFIEVLKQQGKTILYTTHYMEEAERFSDKIGIIDNGQILIHGSFNDIKKQVNIPAQIHVQFEGDANDIDQSVKKNLSNRNVSVNQNELVLETHDFRNDLKNIVLLFSESKADIVHIEKKEANLETIFLKLTGKTLRD